MMSDEKLASNQKVAKVNIIWPEIDPAALKSKKAQQY